MILYHRNNQTAMANARYWLLVQRKTYFGCSKSENIPISEVEAKIRLRTQLASESNTVGKEQLLNCLTNQAAMANSDSKTKWERWHQFWRRLVNNQLL